MGAQHIAPAVYCDLPGGLHIVALQKQSRAQSPLPKEPILHHPDIVAGFQGDKGGIHGLLQVDGRAGGQRLGQGGVGGSQNADGLPLNDLIDQPGDPALGRGQGQVHLTLQHHLLQHGAARLPQLQTDLGKGLNKFGQDLGEQTGGALHADPKAQPPLLLLTDLLDFIFQNLIGVEHSLGGPEVALPGVGGAEGLGGAVEQLHPQLLLNLVEHLAERGLANVQFFCCRGDASLLGDGADVAGLFQVHGVPS